MPNRPPKPATRKKVLKKTYEERQRARWLATPANYGHIVTLERRIEKLDIELARANFNLAVMVDILNEKRVRLPGLKLFRKTQWGAMAKKRLEEARARVKEKQEQDARAEAEAKEKALAAEQQPSAEGRAQCNCELSDRPEGPPATAAMATPPKIDNTPGDKDPSGVPPGVSSEQDVDDSHVSDNHSRHGGGQEDDVPRTRKV